MVPLDFEVENRLIIDEEPFLLPLLERWYGEPPALIVLCDSEQAHFFLAHRGHPEWIRDLERGDMSADIQRDKPRFTFKKRFARVLHERLHSLKEDRFLHEVAGVLTEEWDRDHYSALILLGQPPLTSELRRLLSRGIEQAIAGEAPHAMTDRPSDLNDQVGQILEHWRTDREQKLLTELHERWKRNYLVANGPTEVLDALQQGRTTHVLFGPRRDMTGARCADCGYRFGTPVDVCPHCRGKCNTVNVTQEILRMAVRHRVPVHLCRPGTTDDPLAPLGVAAFLRGESNWAQPANTVIS